ncbi:2-oxoglutarate dehydrogenase complex dihydrolipoyllysine-residue succinyltransferase [Bacteroidetes bacterium endosymbiont of Geopemphigus sp.]|uniref:2-oxoglutarate dehydrogenase complex dihydrolipoyllysine-residue succinyltransferase n=1 Tax=Bacteroidetes bacterium endosymbiont of Geopemphigus sp. TaxID=2047937 RepID=UPI000CD04D86|nr:2-oxoglutarate dehydrogenase complex dihydrolipoyllysine-residue succinyltransferase [Bacteroidetes bacterium endosymbiont of Geopemphigus sp.]
MILEMKVPSPGESITEVEIASWLVKDGDYVSKEQAIAEVDSDKATLELPAEQSGVITLKAKEGDTLQVGQVVCLINTSVRSPENTKESMGVSILKKQEETKMKISTDRTPEVFVVKNIASPAAKKILAEKNISFQQIIGSGRQGRITKEDAIKAVPSMGNPTSALRSLQRERLSKLRRKLAERLVSVKNETAMLTTFNELDMSEIFSLRNQYKDPFKERHGVSLGFMSFFTKACVHALQVYPQVNSMIDGQEKVIYDFYDISVAVSGPKGLIVPVVRNAENLSFRGIEQEIKRLAFRVRDSQISVDEMSGGTFTITNGGVFGSMLSTPIINPPQSAILGMHNIVDRPVVIDKKIEIRPIMYLALSYDHRIIDGRESVGFLVAVKEALENPLEFLMNGNAQIALEL